MGNIRKPRRGSMQFWPRKRSRHSVARIRTWTTNVKAKPLAFIGYKAGMTHLLVVDNKPKSQTKGESIMVASTIVDCPPMTVAGICFYKKFLYGPRKVATVMAGKLAKELGKKMPLPKKAGKKAEEVTDFDDVRILVHSNPKLTTFGTKKPKLMEITLGGTKEEKLAYAREVLGKEIKIEDVFEKGSSLDVHGISTGKGFQGTVKRFGVPIRQHKAEKTKRGIGNLGSWTPKRVQFQVPQSGKMGYHSRTEYNKQLLKIGLDGKEITPTGGKINYGLINNAYVLLRGSIVGPKKRAVVLTPSIRSNPKMTKDAPEIKYTSLTN